MTAGLDIVDVAYQYQFSIDEVAFAYFSLSDKLDTYWFKEALNLYVATNEWENIAREMCLDDLDTLVKLIVIEILNAEESNLKLNQRIDLWLEKNHAAISRWKEMLNLLKLSVENFSIFTVAVRELKDASTPKRKKSKVAKQKTADIK